MSRAAGVLVALLVVLAGCSTLPGDGAGPPGTTLGAGDGDGVAATDGAWPSEATAPTPEGAVDADRRGGDATRLPPSIAMNYPPGIAPDGVYDLGLLTDSHARRLNGTAYTLEWTETTRGPNGTVRSRLVHRVESGDRAGRLHVRINATGPNGSDDLAVFRANGTTHVRGGGDGLPDPPATTTADGALRYDPARTVAAARLLGAFALDEVTPGRTGDRRRYLVRSDRLTDPDALVDAPGARVSNASLSALLDQSAVVHDLTVEYDVHRNGTRTHHVRTLRVTLIERTTVTRPGWVDGNVTAESGRDTATHAVADG